LRSQLSPFLSLPRPTAIHTLSLHDALPISLQKCSSVHVATNPPSHSTKESLATSVHFSQFYLRGARLLPFSDRLVFSVELCTPLQMTTVSHLRGPHSTMSPRGRKGFVNLVYP